MQQIYFILFYIEALSKRIRFLCRLYVVLIRRPRCGGNRPCRCSCQGAKRWQTARSNQGHQSQIDNILRFSAPPPPPIICSGKSTDVDRDPNFKKSLVGNLAANTPFHLRGKTDRLKQCVNLANRMFLNSSIHYDISNCFILRFTSAWCTHTHTHKSSRDIFLWGKNCISNQWTINCPINNSLQHCF